MFMVFENVFKNFEASFGTWYYLEKKRKYKSKVVPVNLCEQNKVYLTGSAKASRIPGNIVCKYDRAH